MVIYNCDICNYTTIRKNQYQRHLNTKKHHKNAIISGNECSINEGKKKSLLRCPFCNNTFSTNTLFAQHLHDNHLTELNSVKTQNDNIYCENNINELKKITQSNTIVTQNEPTKNYVCEFCNKDFK